MSDRIELIPIKNLIGKKFCIPNYQRGYRWGRQQVRDLLEDIAEYMNPSEEVKDDFYCLQPLVVCEKVDNDKGFLNDLPKEPENALPATRDAIAKHVEWDVIDGQQRLTTIHLLLSFLNLSQEPKAEFTIRYATREKSHDFLTNIANKTNEDAKNNIDFWHMSEAYAEIKDWFKTSEKSIIQFKETLLNKVQFIWYESSEDPIKVFTRLNIGKIGLTNSELIKALMLNRLNFEGQDADKIRLRQLEIAVKWDEIESRLQDDEFWMFLHDKGFDKPTRIDFLFDLVCDLGMFDEFIEEFHSGQQEKKVEDKQRNLGSDRYRTFRYFNAYFKSAGAKEECNKVKKSLIEMCWDKVDEIFATFGEWFDDLRLYHYVGFLVDQKIKVSDIYDKWRNYNTKSDFLSSYLIPTITKEIAGCKYLDTQYEICDGNGKNVTWKTTCRPLLLLHNLQTVINQNIKQSADGLSGVFYKFPFHLYKTEGWDIEHIDSNSTNDMNDDKAMIEFLANEYSVVSTELQGRIREFCKNPTKDDFKALQAEIDSEIGKVEVGQKLDDLEKNRIWNFALLDSHTNRSYGNAIFSAKRRIIIGKDKGKCLSVPKLVKNGDHWKIELGEEKEASSSFIPPCTRQVFLKYYSAIVTSPNYWLRPDAENYKEDIFATLKMFGVVKNGGNKKEVK